MPEIKIERTGKQYFYASSEFLVTFPDRSTKLICSPVWNDYINPKEEEENALIYANELWQEKLQNNP